MRQILYAGVDAEFHDKEMELIFDSREATCFLALSESNEPVGLLELSLRNFVDGCLGAPVGYIEGVYLEPKHRGQGHGSQLVEFAAGWFKTHGCRDMATDVEIQNVDAQEFCRRVGFNETWRVVEFKRSLREL